MGYHKDVKDAVKALVAEAVTVPVVDYLTVDEAKAQRLGTFVAVHRKEIDYQATEYIGGGPQYERWTWDLLVVGGAGSANPSNAADVVDDLLEALRTELAMTRPTADCGPLNLVTEAYEDVQGFGVMYRQSWTHDRLGS